MAGHFDKGRINYLAFAGDETLLCQPRVEGGEAFAEKFGARELLAKLAEGVLIRNRVGFGQAEKMLKTAAVEDLKLRLLIAQTAERLEHENFEQGEGQIGRATARGFRLRARNPACTETKIVQSITALRAAIGSPKRWICAGRWWPSKKPGATGWSIGQLLSCRQFIPFTYISRRF